MQSFSLHCCKGLTLIWKDPGIMMVLFLIIRLYFFRWFFHLRFDRFVKGQGFLGLPRPVPLVSRLLFLLIINFDL
jgi:hypothetical protein